MGTSQCGMCTLLLYAHNIMLEPIWIQAKPRDRDTRNKHVYICTKLDQWGYRKKETCDHTLVQELIVLNVMWACMNDYESNTHLWGQLKDCKHYNH